MYIGLLIMATMFVGFIGFFGLVELLEFIELLGFVELLKFIGLRVAGATQLMADSAGH